MYDFTPGNYSAKFLEQFERIEFPHPNDQSNLRTLCEAIRRSVHFGLPNFARILPSRGDVENLIDFDVLMPPFDNVVLEYTAIGGRPTTATQVSTSKRLVLITTEFAPGSVTIIPICYVDTEKMWSAPLIAIHFPLSPAPGSGLIAGLNVEYTVSMAFPHRTREILAGAPESQILDNFSQDYGDEIYAYLEFVAALSCTNIGSEDRPQPRALLASRQRRGRRRLFDYKVLTIQQSGGSHRTGNEPSGRHSPVSHLRRGHIRHLETGKRVWICAAMIGAGEGAFLHKSYKIKPLTPRNQ